MAAKFYVSICDMALMIYVEYEAKRIRGSRNMKEGRVWGRVRGETRRYVYWGRMDRCGGRETACMCSREAWIDIVGEKHACVLGKHG